MRSPSSLPTVADTPSIHDEVLAVVGDGLSFRHRQDPAAEALPLHCDVPLDDDVLRGHGDLG
jgi:hypothetical protein